jgi:hypothetical protein
VAVLANVDGTQADAAVRAVDRWVARRSGESRACPAMPPLPTPRPGTYAVDRPAGAGSEAILAFALPPRDRDALVSATWLAAALDGPDGLLARSLGSAFSANEGSPAWSARVLGAPLAPALVIRLRASDGSIDATVAQARTLLEKLRFEGPKLDDWSRAASAVSAEGLAASLQPRQRIVQVWLSQEASRPPSLEALRSFAASFLHDEALLVVAARPPRVEPSPRATVPGRRTR